MPRRRHSNFTGTAYMFAMDALATHAPDIVAVRRDREGQLVLVADDGVVYAVIARRDAIPALSL